VFETDDKDGSALWACPLQKLEAIADAACTSRIRMEKIDSPILRFCAVVPKRPSDLELESPLAGNEKVGRPLSCDLGSIARHLPKIVAYQLEQLRFAIWADSGTK
jgi:hypothetical protein